ncbi:hypothetical protein GQX73_g497 [Xylaria multiplex]|uniref:Zn(2)-C6 fungal-type domain-containing protein n=1 Tax=Xylaria multiplex TaxID=323545 RepID=A0A7C8MWC4_9PEZI|nr:hypothetical protein GQX73_g497 [Xylaria multiplex]
MQMGKSNQPRPSIATSYVFLVKITSPVRRREQAPLADYLSTYRSEKGALRRLRQNLAPGDDYEDIVRNRFQMINVWRPLNGPVVDWPLAQMDFTTLDAESVHPCDLWRGQYEERGQTVTIEHHPKQKWWYLGSHCPDEVTLLKIWDSWGDRGIATMCAHAAFQHPHTPHDAAPRESVEVRCLVKCSGEKTGCARCRNIGADCVFQESRVGKVPGIRAKRKQANLQKQAATQNEYGLPAEKKTDSIFVSTETDALEHGRECEPDHGDTMSWSTGWQLEPSDTTTFSLLNEMDTRAQKNIDTTHSGTTEGSSGSAGFGTADSSEESYILTPPDTNLDELLMFQLGNPLQPEQTVGLETTSGMPISLGLRPRSEGDSQCCLECCQMINDLENYIMAELKAFKILLGIIRRALGRLAELINLRQDLGNLRCIMLFMTLMHQILELLDACLSIALAEPKGRGFSGGSLGIGFGDSTIDAEEQSAFRIQTILKEVNQAVETLGKLRALATGTTGHLNSSDCEDINRGNDHCLDLELGFKELRQRIQRTQWRGD